MRTGYWTTERHPFILMKVTFQVQYKFVLYRFAFMLHSSQHKSVFLWLYVFSWSIIIDSVCSSSLCPVNSFYVSVLKAFNSTGIVFLGLYWINTSMLETQRAARQRAIGQQCFASSTQLNNCHFTGSLPESSSHPTFSSCRAERVGQPS